MKSDQIVALSVRLFAIVVAIYALRNGISLLTAYYTYAQGFEIESLVYSVVMVVFILIAIALWRFPLFIARGLINFQGLKESDSPTSIDAEQLQIIGITILGVYYLFQVLSDLAYWLFILFMNQRNHVEMLVEDKAAIFSTLIELIIVLSLLLGAKGISKLLHQFRYGNVH